MNKIRLKSVALKVSLKVSIILAVVYLLCLVYCTASVFRMQALTYNSTGWGIVLAEYQLDFVDDCAELNFYNFDGTLSSHAEQTISVAQQAKVKLVCAISLMPLWRDNYYNPLVQDGDHWHTIMTYVNREKTTYGSNSYPLTYRFVYHSIKSVFDSMT